MAESHGPIDADLRDLERAALAAHAEGRHGDAALLHARAIARSRDLGRPRLVAVLFSRLGLSLDAQGDIQRAVQAFEAGLETLDQAHGVDLEAELTSLGLVGKSYGWPDLLEMPDLYFPSNPDDLEAAEDDPQLAVKLLINIGNAYLRQPQESPALNAYERALARPESVGDPVLRAHALTHVGIIRRRRDQLDGAQAALTEALALLEAHAAPVEARRAWAAMAGIWAERGAPERARTAYERALALYEESDDPAGLGRVLAGWGHLQRSLGDVGPARETFERALTLLPTAATETLWYVLWGLGCCQAEAGELSGAQQSLQRSLALIERQGRQLRTDEGRVTFLDSVQTIYERLLSVQLDLAAGEAGGWDEALATAEKARGQAFEGLLASRRAGQARTREGQELPGGREPGVRESRLRPFADRLALGDALVEPSDLDAAPWAQRAPSVDLSFSPMAQRAPSIDLTPPALSPQQAAAHIPVDGTQSSPRQEEERTAPPPMARLVYHTLPDRTAIFAVDVRGHVTGHVSELGREAWAERISRLRAALGVESGQAGVRLVREKLAREAQDAPESDLARRVSPVHATTPAGLAADAQDELRPLLRELYAELVAPVDHALPTDGAPLVIEPHGPLWLLPYAALLGPSDGWLGDRWPLLYAPSGDILGAIRAEEDYGKPTDLPALIVGNPELPAALEWGGAQLTLEPLPGAEREAEAIAALFPEERRTLLLGAQAQRGRVQERMQAGGIIHLASHGLADAGDPNGSFVVLGGSDAGALLTARQVLDLWLPADLVALSACQTGLGRVSGDGMIGLSRAFLAAGARAVLVSLWSVSDAATAALMVAFYQGYLALDDKAIALQRAMRSVRSQPAYGHPRFWAPFLVIGAEA